MNETVQPTQEPKTARRPKSKGRYARAALLSAATLAAVVLLASFFGKSAYRMIKEHYYALISKTPHEDITFDEYSGNTVTLGLDELALDSRATFDQSGMLINTEHLLEDGFEADAVEYNDSGVYMNRCITEGYKALADEVRERFSEKLYVSSAYRTADEQLNEESEEGDVAQKVGASEHQAGLALDVYVLYHGGMGFIETEAGQWVNTDCWRYGFIIRYPMGKNDETGISYEPWHLRYVGAPHSEYIMKSGLTLEEYFDILSDGKLRYIKASDGEYVIVRQSGEEFTVPAEYESAVISPDNTGGYILTFKIK